MTKKDKYISKIYSEIELNLSKVQEEIYKTELSIKSTNARIDEIVASIDTSYSILSASGTADDFTNTEIESLKKIVDNKTKVLDNLYIERDNLSARLEEITLLSSNKPVANKKNNSMDVEDIINKLQLIYKLCIVDTDRARQEITLLIEKLSKKEV